MIFVATQKRYNIFFHPLLLLLLDVDPDLTLE
jgi:hypothetical protein